MHELSLATSIVDQLTEATISNGGHKVLSVRILLGPLSGVVEESLVFCFSEACHGSMAEGAELIIEKSPLIVKCHRCQKESEVSPHHLLCPSCLVPDISVLSGKEFRIIDLEVI